MTDKKTTLLKLNKNLNILQEREAKYGGNAPLDLLNQIDDHKQAIDLTRQVITGEISEQEWEEALKSLLLAMNNDQVVNIEAETYVAGNVKGDIVVGDKVSGDKILGDKIITVTYEAPPPAEARTRADLDILLKNVETTWIKGVLEKSVHEAVLLDLGRETRSDAVDHPWQMVIESPDQVRQPLPSEKTVKDIFEEANRLLLILGDPGSGKTTTLLQLTRELIAETKQNPTFSQPIPVMFNLSTWINKQQPLDEWLIAEMQSKYRVPKKQGRQWLEDRRILPLLDGLDEVKPENRTACVENINRLSVGYGLQMVVCSRIKDYTALAVRLAFNSAIYLQPLTAEQINAYFVAAGGKLASLQTTLQQDEALQSLVQSPLMLNIMSLTYQDTPAEDLANPTLDTDESRRQHLFETYIARMFKRKGEGQSYNDEQTKQRLSWLAQNMQRHNQEIFLIEGLQPIWLQPRHWCWVYILASRLLGGLSIVLSVVLSIMLITALRGYPRGDVIAGLTVGLIVGLTGGLIDVLRFETLSNRIETRTSTKLWWSIINIVIVGLIFGLIGGLTLMLFGELVEGLGLLLIGGSISALILGLRGSRQSSTDDIQTVETLRWSWREALRGGLMGLTLGLVFLVIGGLIDMQLFAQSFAQSFALSNVLAIGLIGLAVGVALNGLSRGIIETKTAPNQGVRLSVRNAIFGGLVVGLIVGLIGMIYELYLSLLGGLLGGLLGVLWYGGLDIIQHYTLRIFLITQGHTPRDYARFLDYAANLIFLQKVGGGYRFIHRMLLEHFAQMSIEGNQSE